MKASVILSILGSAASVFAHGYVTDLKIDGQVHRAYQPFNDPYSKNVQRIGWTIPDNGPVEDVTSKAIVCGVNSQPGALVAPAKAGSEITFFWTEWPVSHTGPAMTYLASCPSGDCRKEDPSTLNWFKIDHAGLAANGVWASDALIANNNTWTVTIPSQLKAGAYLLRHELLALHASHTINGSQFYPMCANLEISGSGNGVPASTVKFPGAYKNTDAGIFINIYYPVPTTYEIPGPAVAQIIAGGSAATTTKPAVAEPTTTKAATTTAPPVANAPAITSTLTSTVYATSGTPVTVTVTAQATANACGSRRRRSVRGPQN